MKNCYFDIDKNNKTALQPPNCNCFELFVQSFFSSQKHFVLQLQYKQSVKKINARLYGLDNTFLKQVHFYQCRLTLTYYGLTYSLSRFNLFFIFFLRTR